MSNAIIALSFWWKYVSLKVRPLRRRRTNVFCRRSPRDHSSGEQLRVLRGPVATLLRELFVLLLTCVISVVAFCPLLNNGICLTVSWYELVYTFLQRTFLYKDICSAHRWGSFISLAKVTPVLSDMASNISHFLTEVKMLWCSLDICMWLVTHTGAILCRLSTKQFSSWDNSVILWHSLFWGTSSLSVTEGCVLRRLWLQTPS